MIVRCYNCQRDLSAWNVGRDGRAVLGDICTMRLVMGVPDSVLKVRAKIRPPKADINKDKILKKIGG